MFSTLGAFTAIVHASSSTFELGVTNVQITFARFYQVKVDCNPYALAICDDNDNYNSYTLQRTSPVPGDVGTLPSSFDSDRSSGAFMFVPTTRNLIVSNDTPFLDTYGKTYDGLITFNLCISGVCGPFSLDYTYQDCDTQVAFTNPEYMLYRSPSGVHPDGQAIDHSLTGLFPLTLNINNLFLTRDYFKCGDILLTLVVSPAEDEDAALVSFDTTN